jgi:hypothetical protein
MKPHFRRKIKGLVGSIGAEKISIISHWPPLLDSLAHGGASLPSVSG